LLKSEWEDSIGDFEWKKQL
jgi:hypothetical protein